VSKKALVKIKTPPGTPEKFVTIDTDPIGRAILGVNMYYEDAHGNLYLLSSADILNSGSVAASNVINFRGDIPAGSGSGGSGVSTGVSLSGDVVGGPSGGVISASVQKINGAPLGATTLTIGNFLVSNGSNWASYTMTGDVSVVGATVVIGNNKVTNAKLATAAALTVKCNPTNAAANEQDLAVTAASNKVLMESGSALAFNLIGASNIAANAVGNAALAQAGAYTLKGNATNATANETDMSVTTFQTNFNGAAVTADGTFGATGTINFNGTPPSYLHTCTLTTATPCTLTLTAPPVSGVIVGIEITQPASGTVTTVSWPTTVTNVIAYAPQPNNVLGSTTVFFFYWDGTNYYLLFASSYNGSGGAAIVVAKWTNLNTGGRVTVNVNGATIVGAGSTSGFGAGNNSLNILAASGGAIGFGPNNTFQSQIDTNQWARGFTGVGGNTEFSNGTFGATGNVAWLTNGQYQSFTTTTLTACTVSYTSTPPCPCWLTLKIIAPAAGTSPAVTLPGRGTTVITPTLAKDTIMLIYYDGTTYWNQAAVPNA
jgi:hypothetical protein